MFKKTTLNPYLGELISQGQSKIWTAQCTLAGFDDEFLLRIWGDKNGLMPHQEWAVCQLFDNIAQIKKTAALPMLQFWQNIDFLKDYLPNEVLKNRQAIWQWLHPAYSEIREDGEIALGFVFYTGDYLVFLKINNGQFTQISTE